MEITDILKVMDVKTKSVDTETVIFLEQYYCVYRDTVCGEHLLDANSANEPDAMSKSKSRKVKKEIKLLSLAASLRDCAYVRFVP